LIKLPNIDPSINCLSDIIMKYTDIELLTFNESLDWFIVTNKAYTKICNYVQFSDKIEQSIFIQKNVNNFNTYVLNILVKSNYTYNTNLLNKPEIILIQQSYQQFDQQRKKEIDHVLQLNLLNKFIDKIYLLNEQIYDFSHFQDNNKIVQFNINKRLTYDDSFKFASRNKIRDNIIIFANLDIEITTDIEKLYEYNFNNIVYCLTRYDIDYTNTINLSNPILKSYIDTNTTEYMFSQDTWIYRPNKINFDSSIVNFYYGIPSCDNVLVCELNKQGVDTFNIPQDIKTIHHHKNQIRNYTKRLDKRIVPLYVVKYENINKLIEIKNNYKLTSIQLNYFMKNCDILKLEDSTYEAHLNKLLNIIGEKEEKGNTRENEEKGNTREKEEKGNTREKEEKCNTREKVDKFTFIEKVENIIKYNNILTQEDKEQYIIFIKNFFYYKDLCLINSYDDINKFIFTVLSYIYYGKLLKYEENFNLNQYIDINVKFKYLNNNLYNEWSNSFNELFTSTGILKLSSINEIFVIFKMIFVQLTIIYET
jgi:hypothetical protein